MTWDDDQVGMSANPMTGRFSPASVVSKYYVGSLGWLPSRTILLVTTGSRAYGTDGPDSDLDLRGVCVAPLEYYFTYRNSFKQEEQKEPTDLTIFEIRKYLELASKCNPGVLELLFRDEKEYLVLAPPGRLLWDNRKLFISKRAFDSYLGYSMQQSKKMENNKRDPHPKKNAKRAALVEKYGYDTKFAVNLVRLLRQGLEVLTTGEVLVRRPDAEELKRILNGAWTFDYLTKYVDSLRADIEKAYSTSVLPDVPDLGKIDDLCMEICRQMYT